MPGLSVSSIGDSTIKLFQDIGGSVGEWLEGFGESTIKSFQGVALDAYKLLSPEKPAYAVATSASAVYRLSRAMPVMPKTPKGLLSYFSSSALPSDNGMVAQTKAPSKPPAAMLSIVVDQAAKAATTGSFVRWDLASFCQGPVKTPVITYGRF